MGLERHPDQQIVQVGPPGKCDKNLLGCPEGKFWESWAGLKWVRNYS